jgi:hypothetical protein
MTSSTQDTTPPVDLAERPHDGDDRPREQDFEDGAPRWNPDEGDYS